MEQILKSILLLSCIGAVLTVVLLFSKPITKKIFGSHWHYYIWLCVLIVFILPVNFQMSARENINTPPIKVIDAVTISSPALAETTMQNIPSTIVDMLPTNYRDININNEFALNLFNIMFYIWIFGAALAFFATLVRYLIFLNVLHKNSEPIICTALEELKSKKGIKRNIQVRISACTTTPVMLGLFKSTLLLPNTKMNENELYYVLLHELTHLKKQDILYKWFAMIVNSIHWFNPLMYFACKQINEECEISCDLSVTKNMSEKEKNNYMNTILSLATSNKQKNNLLTTAMVSSKQQLKRRFTMIKKTNKTSKILSTISIITAMFLFSTSIFASGVLANSMDIYAKATSEIEVFNDDKKIEFTNKPFIDDGEIYLPLRETLNGFGITDIRWNNGSIYVTMQKNEYYKGFGNEITDCKITIGSKTMTYPSLSSADYVQGNMLKFPPVIKNGITYVTMDLFESLMSHGQVPRFKVKLIQSKDAKDYYVTGEEVFIGTGLEQDNYNPTDANGNKRFVKRIVTDDKGEVRFIVTVDNQKPEVIRRKDKTSTASMEGFGDKGSVTAWCYNAYGEFTTFFTGIFVYQGMGTNTFTDIAYIPPAYQINYTEAKSAKSKLTIAVVTELSKKGHDLNWSDFEKFESADIGSGLHILEYAINDQYKLLISGGSKDKKPSYINLVNKINNKTIDIRDADVKAYLLK